MCEGEGRGRGGDIIWTNSSDVDTGLSAVAVDKLIFSYTTFDGLQKVLNGILSLIAPIRFLKKTLD